MATDWKADLRGGGGWVWHDGPMTQREDMALLFDRLNPPPGTSTIRLYVSADNRYQLFVNPGDGPRRLGRGPARGDLQHTSLDSYTLECKGDAACGVQIWAAARWSAGRPETPIAEMHSPQPGFLLIATFHDAEANKIGRSATGKHWKVIRANAIGANFSYGFHNWVWHGAYENHHAQAWPMDWLSEEGAGENWKSPRMVEGIYFKGDPPWQSMHWLVPRIIPHMREVPAKFAAMASADDFSSASLPEFPIRVAPGETLSLIFDASVTTNAYPAVRLSGAGSILKLTYAELMRHRRDGKVGKHFSLYPGSAVEGPFDTCALGEEMGERVHLFEPFHWRAFRFIRLDLAAGACGATLHDFSMSVTGYPLDRKISIEGEGEAVETMKQMVEVSWRTLDRCCWETLMDCPFYEQLQYIGDARLEALQLYVGAGDWTLAREALRAFDRSRLSEGISQACYPSSAPLVIPPFSLLQVLMADDYLRYTRDESLIAELRPGLAQILDWFAPYIDGKTGLLGQTPYWPFVDWVEEWKAGMLPSPCNAPINLHLLLALQAAERLSLPRQAGSPTYAARARQFRRRIREAFWDESLGLMRDEPMDAQSDPPQFSQHAQALATLGGVLSVAEARNALKHAIYGHPSGLSMKSASYYFSFYLAEAAAGVGLGTALWTLLEPFRAALARGSTTWPEMFEPSRSECHAFSAWPLYFFARYVLGVCPPDNGGEIDVRPLYCPPLDRISGRVMTYRGPIVVSVEWHGRRAQAKITKEWM